MLFSRPAPTFHDAAGGARDDHEAGLSHAPAEIDCLRVRGMIHRQAGRAEHRHFPPLAIGGEDFEGVAQFLERGAQELDVATVRLVADQLVGGFFELLNQLLDADGRSAIVVQRVVNVFERAAFPSQRVAFHPKSLSS